VVGAFEFSADVLMSSEEGGIFGFGGLPLEAHSENDWSVLRSMPTQRRRQGPAATSPNAGFNRMTLQSNGKVLQFLINDHLEYQQSLPAITSPFLSLNAIQSQRAVFRNLNFRGDLEIPREVALTNGELLDGWSADRYYEKRPQRLPQEQFAAVDDEGLVKEAATEDGDESQSDEDDGFQWRAKAGVINARQPDAAAAGLDIQSLLVFDRPLDAGDSLRYEFFYEPGKFEVHPALGQLAFLIDRAGVRLHWMTDPEENNTQNSLPADNAVDEPACRRGPQPLPLKTGEWNQVRLAIAADVAVLELNGSEIYRRPLEPTNDRRFGFFRDPSRHGVQVRSVFLSGDWPRHVSTEQLGDLLARNGEASSSASNRTRMELIGDDVLATNWQRVRQQARELPVADRYELLREWVLPEGDRTTFRLSGGFLPTLPALSETTTNPELGDSRSSRRIAGGDIVAPALDLIEAAGQLKKLDELERLVFMAVAANELEQRNRLALLTLIGAARHDFKASAAYLTQLAQLSDKIPRDAPETEHWPELLAASVSLSSPDLARPALKLVDRLAAQIETQKSPSSGDLELLAFRQRIEALSHAPQEGLSLKQWAQVSHGSAQSLSRGALPPLWLTRRGEARHVAGLEHDLLYFQSPLRGDFDVTCRLTAAKRQEMQVGYAGFRIGLVAARDKYDKDTYEIGRIGFVPEQRMIQPRLVDLGETYEYRLAVHDGVCTSSINGIRIHEEAIAVGCDPWLTLHSAGVRNGAAGDLRITGTPRIPDNLDLLGLAELTGWLADFYEPGQSTDQGPWKKEQDMLLSARRKDLTGTRRQSLIRYHRPLLEDGQIEYEFYYEHGKKLVHPAVDRLTFLLDPNGVRIHWLTDAQFDRTGLSHDNVTDEPANRRGPKALPLLERAWNRMKLALKGDVVSLSLNGETIYERSLEPTNQRSFGLFHYSDETEARVRQITYQGNWPRALPALADQELAVGK
jgi:hypothetical protein